MWQDADQLDRHPRGGFPAPSPLSGWTLEADFIHLNHGAFGGVPNDLRSVQNQWRARMEANPSRFFMDELFDHLGNVAAPLAEFVGTAPDRLALVENASAGIATVLAGLDFVPGDRIIATSHGYGAVRNMLGELARRRGVEIIEVAIPCPVGSEADVEARLAAKLERGARLVILDHVTSPSALILPIRSLVALCHAERVPVLVDGSHAPGMIELAVDAIGADWYVGNCHKWLCAPRGAAFLVAAKPETAPHPLVISHAYGSGFPLEFRKVGTRDPSAALTVPAAIAFHEQLGGAGLRARNRALVAAGANLVAEAIMGKISGPAAMRGAMASISIPGLVPTTRTALDLRLLLRERYRIETLALAFADRLWLRLSAHAYNTLSDFEHLADILPGALAGLAKDQRT